MNELGKPDELAAVVKRLAATPSDEGAWRSLYRQMWPFIVAVAYRRLRDKGMAEDVAQDVFIRLFQSQPQKEISDPSQFRAYVWRMTVNAANTAFQKRRPKHPSDATFEELARLDVSDPSTSPDSRLYLREALGLVRDTLEPQDVRLLTLLLQGRSLSEVAKDLGISYSNAGVRLHRVRQTMLKLLNPNE
jgi:RNA polymerase sigma-70 factor (ECF subfamily)